MSSPVHGRQIAGLRRRRMSPLRSHRELDRCCRGGYYPPVCVKTPSVICFANATSLEREASPYSASVRDIGADIIRPFLALCDHLIHRLSAAPFSLAAKRPPFVTCGDISPAGRGNHLEGKANKVVRDKKKSGSPKRVSHLCDQVVNSVKNYSLMAETTPEPTVRPPSRIAKRRPSSIAMGVISSTSISTLSPGMHISTPSGRLMTPVTSVVRK